MLHVCYKREGKAKQHAQHQNTIAYNTSTHTVTIAMHVHVPVSNSAVKCSVHVQVSSHQLSVILCIQSLCHHVRLRLGGLSLQRGWCKIIQHNQKECSTNSLYCRTMPCFLHCMDMVYNFGFFETYKEMSCQREDDCALLLTALSAAEQRLQLLNGIVLQSTENVYYTITQRLDREYSNIENVLLSTVSAHTFPSLSRGHAPLTRDIIH